MRPIKVFGYHGTTAKSAESILREGFKGSENWHDWLGKGVYFFQDAPFRAWEWADYQASRVGGEPAVIQVGILLDDCMDLLDINWADVLTFAYNEFCKNMKEQGEALPLKTKGAHRLDRVVIDYAVEISRQHGKSIGAIRGVFVEGIPVFPESHLYDKAHVQIAVRRPELIVDMRRVRRNDDGCR